MERVWPYVTRWRLALADPYQTLAKLKMNSCGAEPLRGGDLLPQHSLAHLSEEAGTDRAAAQCWVQGRCMEMREERGPVRCEGLCPMPGGRAETRNGPCFRFHYTFWVSKQEVTYTQHKFSSHRSEGWKLKIRVQRGWGGAPLGCRLLPSSSHPGEGDQELCRSVTRH